MLWKVVAFNKPVADELLGLTKSCSNTRRYNLLLFNETNIHCNIVFDKNTGQLSGFADTEDSTVSYATFEKQDELASYVLTIFIKRLTTDSKF